MYISGTYPYLSRIFDHELSIIYQESIFPLFCNGFMSFTSYYNPVVLFTFYFCLILCNNIGVMQRYIGVTFLHKYCFFICTIPQPHFNQSWHPLIHYILEHIFVNKCLLFCPYIALESISIPYPSNLPSTKKPSF